MERKGITEDVVNLILGEEAVVVGNDNNENEDKEIIIPPNNKDNMMKSFKKEEKEADDYIYKDKKEKEVADKKGEAGNKENNKKGTDNKDSDISDNEIISTVLDTLEDGTKKEKKEARNIISKLVEEGKIMLYEDKPKLDDYTDEEIIELLEENIENKASIIADDNFDNFMNKLPKEIQLLVKYVSEGGRDYEKFLQDILMSKDVKYTLGKDDEQIVRAGLRIKGFSEDEINDEIETYKKANVLHTKAARMLDIVNSYKDKVLEEKNKELEIINQKRKEASEKFIERVGEVLSHQEVANIKLDRKTRADIYEGLTSLDYKYSDGRPTNEFGYLLEKYQVTEPDYNRVILSYIALKNPDVLIENIKRSVEEEVTKDIYKKLKLEMSSGKASGNTSEEIENKERPKKEINVIKRRFFNER